VVDDGTIVDSLLLRMLMGKMNFATRKANGNADFPAIILMKWIEFDILYIVVKEEDNIHLHLNCATEMDGFNKFRRPAHPEFANENTSTPPDTTVFPADSHGLGIFR